MSSRIVACRTRLLAMAINWRLGGDGSRVRGEIARLARQTLGLDPGGMHVYSFPVHKLPVGVLGASGYAGRELCALIARHPALSLHFASANERKGEVARLGGQDVRFVAHDDAHLEGCALIFSALPHGASAPWVRRALDAGARVVDLSADLRPGSAQADRGVRSAGSAPRAARSASAHTAAPAATAIATAPHPASALGDPQTATYGLTEINRVEIPAAKVV